MACVLAAASNAGLTGLEVWLFMGPYLALTGWAAAVLGMATNVRLMGAVDGLLAPVTQAG